MNQLYTRQGFMRGRSRGFTLIELLVVVLIIGILAAVAVPQYQKAVEKSKAAQAFAMIRSVAAAQEAYHLANGTYATTFDKLDVSIPWTEKVRWIDGSSHNWAVYSNDEWSLQLYYEASGIGVSVGRISGPYAGAGFVYLLESSNDPIHTLLCHENDWTGGQSITFSKSSGAYCKKIFHTKGTRLSPIF